MLGHLHVCAMLCRAFSFEAWSVVCVAVFLVGTATHSAMSCGNLKMPVMLDDDSRDCDHMLLGKHMKQAITQAPQRAALFESAAHLARTRSVPEAAATEQRSKANFAAANAVQMVHFKPSSDLQKFMLKAEPDSWSNLQSNFSEYTLVYIYICFGCVLNLNCCYKVAPVENVARPLRHDDVVRKRLFEEPPAKQEYPFFRSGAQYFEDSPHVGGDALALELREESQFDPPFDPCDSALTGTNNVTPAP